MPRIKQVLELVRRRYAQAKGARTAKQEPEPEPPGAARQKPTKSVAPRGVEITRAVFPNKSSTR